MTWRLEFIIIWSAFFWNHEADSVEGGDTVILDEQFDADEILRDVDERYVEEDLEGDEDMRELNFGNVHDENANFSDMASDLDSTDDLWE